MSIFAIFFFLMNINFWTLDLPVPPFLTPMIKTWGKRFPNFPSLWLFWAKIFTSSNVASCPLGAISVYSKTYALFLVWLHWFIWNHNLQTLSWCNFCSLNSSSSWQVMIHLWMKGTFFSLHFFEKMLTFELYDTI